MKVRIASPMRSYTGGRAVVEAQGSTAGEVLVDLDRQFPGLRFRIVDERGRLREHVNLWADQDRIRDLDASVDGASEITIMQALSGG